MPAAPDIIVGQTIVPPQPAQTLAWKLRCCGLMALNPQAPAAPLCTWYMEGVKMVDGAPAAEKPVRLNEIQVQPLLYQSVLVPITVVHQGELIQTVVPIGYLFEAMAAAQRYFLARPGAWDAVVDGTDLAHLKGLCPLGPNGELQEGSGGAVGNGSGTGMPTG